MNKSVSKKKRCKFLVIVDSTPESAVAMRFAARRAINSQGGLVMLYVIHPDVFRHWAGVREVMQQEAREEAEQRMQQLSDELHQLGDFPIELSIREGSRHEQVIEELNENKDIRVLVLASAAGSDNPGPLVSLLVGKMPDSLPVPITVVPGAMTNEQIDDVG